MDHAETYGANLLFVLQYKLANSCCKKKTLRQERYCFVTITIFLEGGVSVTIFVEETIFKKIQDKKMATRNLVTTDRATRESEFPTAVLSSNESLSTQLTGLVVLSLL